MDIILLTLLGDTGKTATSATFDGNTYISYSLIKKKISNNRDEVLFEFRTQSPAGLILSVGEEYDYIYAAMNGGRIEIAINLGSGEYREFITARRGQSGFIDNEWHKVRITRENTEVREIKFCFYIAIWTHLFQESLP